MMGNLLLMYSRRRRGGGVTPMTAITAVTTGAGQTLTLQQLTPTGGDCVVNWGDGGATSTITDGNTGTTTHEYASAGTYQVTITNPHLLTVIDLRDSKIVFNSNNVGGIVPANLTTLYLSGMAAGSTFDSSDFAGATPSETLFLRFTLAGTYAFDSADFATAQPITLIFLFHSDVATTVARADWTGIARYVTSPTIQLGLTDAEVDLVLLGIYDDFANRAATAGTLNVAGSNAAPTGTLQAQCAPTTGKEAAYELVNDSCGVSSKHYAAVTLTA